ncbi:hypothetical protein FAD94_002959 [Enterococcus faecalis]|uniref:hypothetical protein n=1 Tax=Enterococcus faecalis TaxID=1351 RepID=UPI000CF0414E|nr:hypothetical protein [Enterococcus faecalis]EGO8127834.1 hypothetical protein [Enterococcus faecalis]PQC69496.1 hypothetical protein CUN08_10585 [Enterococcus faecalis]HCU0365429.1 hypothetical protein [Enterococcus faecalis]
MDKQQILKELTKKGYGQYASWALYDVTNEQIVNNKVKIKDIGFEPFRNNLEELINLKGIFLALNCATRDVMIDEWSNFHDTRSSSKDFKIPYMIKGTKYEGSYMTDLFKNIPMTESDKFNIVIKKPENRDVYDLSVKLFQYEYDLIKPESIICFGGDVEKHLKQMITNGQIKLDDSVKIIRLTHYSHYASYDTFKEQRKKY